MNEAKEIDQTLLWLLRRAGDDWGPLGVALAAAQLTDPQVVIARLTSEAPTAPEPQE